MLALVAKPIDNQCKRGRVGLVLFGLSLKKEEEGEGKKGERERKEEKKKH